MAGSSSPSLGFAYDVALFFWRLVISVFFREIRPRGAFHIPRDGPVIFVAAPHHNQFLDMLVALQVYQATGRRVQFLVAAKSMQRKFIGIAARLLGSIPVARAADNASSGTGHISLSEEDTRLVVGHGTRFLAELSPRSQILLPKTFGSCTAEVLEVLSDDRLRIKAEFATDEGATTQQVLDKLAELRVSGLEGTEFKRIPHLNQGETFQHVYTCLNEGGCIVIFPEGGSHDRTDLLPLKAGVSLMALGAMANNPSVKVKIVPVGMSYFHPHKFRSRAVVEFGNAMDVPEDLIENFKQGGKSKRESVGKLLDMIHDGLKTVTVRAPDYETLMVIQAARRLYVTPGQRLTLGQVVALNRRFIQAYLQFKDEPKVQKLSQDVMRYNRILQDLGLQDHQVPGARKAGWRTFGLLCYRMLLLAFWAILALPGVILNSPIFLTAKIISIRKAKEALAASTVKIEGRDVLATWKVLISLGLTPVVYGIYAILATLVMIKAQAPSSWVFWTPIYTLAALPWIAFAALKFGEAGMDVLKSLRPLVIALASGQQRYLDKVRDMRVKLSNELSEVIEEYAPKIYADYDKNRILLPSAKAPPSSGQDGALRQRRAEDGQGRLLNHPMSWLDDQLFGWSELEARGELPDDISDYGDHLGRGQAETAGAKIASRNVSYRDLQGLRNRAP